MNRRQYLSATVAVVTAGCTGMSSETHLTPGDASEHGSSAVLPFSDGDDDVLRIQFDKQFTGDEKRDYYPFFISTLQPNGDRIDSLRLEFRSPPHTSGFSPAGIALREDAHAHKATLSQDGDDPSRTVLDLPDTTDIGRGSVKVNLLLEGDREPQQLWIRAEATLSSDGLLGSNYSATGELTVAFP